MKLTTYRHICYWVLIVCVIMGRGITQPLQKPFRKLTTTNGLPQSFISGLVQDNYGFIWISTRNGLVRYDGLHFQLFQHSSQDTASPSSNLIITLKFDSLTNHILIEHESGAIDEMDAAACSIARLARRPVFQQHRIKLLWLGWLKAKDGSFWCVEDGTGLHHYSLLSNTYSVINRQNAKLLSDSVLGVSEDKKAQLWLLSRQGLSCYNPTTRKTTNTLFPPDITYLAADTVPSLIVALHQRPNGEIMFADTRQLIFFQPEQKKFRTMPLPQKNRYGIKWMQTGPDGKEYFEVNGTVFRYDDAQGLKAVGETDMAIFRDAKSFLVDRSGLLWLGTNAAGVQQIDVNAPNFESHAGEEPFHYYLLKKEFGLALDKIFDWPVNSPTFKLSSYFFRSAWDKKGHLWMGLRNKIGYWDDAAKKFVTLPTIPGIADDLQIALGIRGLSIAPNGRLWVVSDGGAIFYFDESRQNWILFKPAAYLRSKFSDNTVIVDLLAENDKLWMTTATGEGLLILDINTGTFKQFNEEKTPGILPTNILQRLQPDLFDPNIIWIGTYEGLVKMDRRTYNTQVFSIKDGLPDNTIYAVVPDKNGFLWLSTNQGLCRFLPTRKQVQKFKVENGLPGNEFNRFNYLRMPDGRMAFGGVDGWVIFNPGLFVRDSYKPQIAFTKLKIHNEPVSFITDEDLLSRPLNESDELNLPHDKNTLSFEFAGLEFNQPEQIKYRYQLLGYDNDWITTETPLASYTQLPPNTYKLRINCSNASGEWSPNIRTLTIVVHPPWWSSGWAYLLYFVLGSIVLYVLYRLWNQRQITRQELLMQQRESAHLRMMDEAKSRFFSNVTHELRTPLSLIIAPLGNLIQMQKENVVKKQLVRMQKNAQQLLQIINQSLDISKLEADSLTISLSRGYINDFIQEQIEVFADAASTKGITLEIQVPYTREHFQFDADKLHTIIFNLLSNAIKFTPKKGRIQVVLELLPGHTAQEEDRLMALQVKDTGIGISTDHQPLIFNRFYQVDDSSTRQYGGTGIGLSLSKDLAETLGGTLTVESNPGSGSVFLLQMPIQIATNFDLPLYATDLHDTINIVEEKLQVPEATMLPSYDQPLILIAEDNPELNEFIVEIFRPLYRVISVTDGLQGMEIARAQLPDVIVSDWMMPGMDGLDFCREVKNNNATNHIAFIQLTAKIAQVSRMKSLQCGADDYLTKPFIAEELKLRVVNLLERQHRLRQKLSTRLTTPQAIEEQNPKAPQQVKDPFLKQVYELVEAHLDDTAFGVEEIAKGVGMSRANLHRKLKTIADLTPGSIIRNYRLQRAAGFLKEGHSSSETAYKTGFETPAYFTKCFKDFFGITPTEYVKKA